jgi:hypothetical protein
MYCYVINYPPKLGPPVTGYKFGMFRGITNRSWAPTRFTMRTTSIVDWGWKMVRTARSTGNDTQQIRWEKVFIYRLSREIVVTRQDYDKMKWNLEMYNSYLAQLNEMIQSAKRKLHDLKKEPNTSWTNYPRASLFDVNPTSQSSDTVDSMSRYYMGVDGRQFFGYGGEWGAN